MPATLTRASLYSRLADEARYHHSGRLPNAFAPIKSWQRPAYFLLAIYYLAKEWLTPLSRGLPPQILFEACAGQASPARSINTQDADLSRLAISQMLSMGTGGDATLVGVSQAILKFQHKVLAPEEVALATGLGVQRVVDAVQKLAARPAREGRAQIFIEDGLICKGPLTDDDIRAAVERMEARYSLFGRAILKAVTNLTGLKGSYTVHQVISALNEHRADLGVRNLDILLLDPGDPTSYTLEHPGILSDELSLPPDFLAQIIAKEDSATVLMLGKDERTTKDSIQAAGLIWNSKLKGFFKTLRDAGQEYVVILKAKSDAGDQAIIALMNPLFFGEDKGAEVLTSLTHVAELIGEKLASLRSPQAGLTHEANGHLQLSVVAEWLARNEATTEGFYDKQTWLMDYLLKMSPAYRESIGGLIEAIEATPTWQDRSRLVSVLDAGVGPGNVALRVLERARDKGVRLALTMLDISRAACARAYDKCQTLIEGDLDIRLGSILTMTKVALKGSDNEPVEHGSKDIVVLNYVLQYTSRLVLAEINRVLKIGGRLIITNFKPGVSMSYDEPKINIKAAWRQGWEKAWLPGAVWQVVLFFSRFLRHPLAIINFARQIDNYVRERIFLPNPTSDELRELANRFGYQLISETDTHEGAAIRMILEKVQELDEDNQPIITEASTQVPLPIS